MVKNPWNRLSSKIVYQNRWLTLREDQVIKPDGEKGVYTVVISPPSVYIIALTHDSKLHLIGQFRYPTQMFSWEIPSGNSNNQDPLVAAKRELQEETGLVAKSWKHIGFFQAMNGIGTEIGHVFVAKNLHQTKKDKRAEEGITQVKTASWQDVFAMIQSGTITDAQSITALTIAALKLGKTIGTIKDNK